MTDDLIDRLHNPSFMDMEFPRELFTQCADRIQQLEAALRDVYEVYAGSEGIPQPMTAAEGYLLHLVREMANTARAALGEKKDD